MDTKHDEWVVMKGHPRWLTRWWLRTQPIQAEITPDGMVGASCEFHVPWWAWPLELAHWALFGRPRLGKLDE